MTFSGQLTPSDALTLEALPAEGELNALFNAARPLLPAAAQRLEILVLDDGGFRTRIREHGVALDVRLRVTSKEGALDVRAVGVDHVPLPAVKALEKAIPIPHVFVDDVTVTRTPRRIAIAAHLKGS